MATDRDAIEELRTISNVDAYHVVQHYLYFSREHDSKSIALILGKFGFEVQNRLGADGVHWLVLAKHQIIPSEETVERLRALFEAVAAEYEGEYDGWEAVVN